MSLLLEAIQILNGIPLRLEYHNERLNRSRHELMCSQNDLFIEEYLHIPEEFSQGKVKCRILYDQEIDCIEFEHYQEREIRSFILKEANIDYPYKYTDRTAFVELKKRLPPNQEVIITKDNCITDTTYSNLIFKDKEGIWHTPLHPLLHGIQREYLLDSGMIIEKEIHKDELANYTHFMMINAMLDFDETRSISIENIIL